MSQLSQAVILVADTDPESLFAISSLLIAHDHRVVTANSFQDALAISNSQPLDLLITDARLGNQCGGDLVGEIRRLEINSDVPVMYISAAQISGVIRRVHDFGAAYHLKKPIVPQVLVELVDKALWMPHLVKNKIEESTKLLPHITFGKSIHTNPFGFDLPTSEMPIIF